jgi:uncharacterized protein (TIGR02588 family)
LTDPQPQPATPPLELALGLLGACVLVALAAFILFSALTGRGAGYPDIRVQVEPAQRQANGWIVPFRAFNEGEAPASQLRIVARAALPDGGAMVADVVIDYLAAGSEDEGGFFFASDPAEVELAVRAVSYLKP